MKFSISSLLLALTDIGIGAHALPTEVQKPSKVETAAAGLHWAGQVSVGGPVIELKGTASDIYRKILEINPKYDEELGITKDLPKRSVWKRDPIFSDSINCRPGGVIADKWYILEGIDVLYRIGNGECWAPFRPGGGGCANAYCYEGSAIILCNDLQGSDLRVPCRLVADNAKGIVDRCQQINQVATKGPNGIMYYEWHHSVVGQIFSFDRNWNVIVKQDIYCGRP